MSNALTGESMGSLAHITPVKRPLVGDIHKMEQERIHFDLGELKVFLAHVKTQPPLHTEIQEAQKDDP